MLKCILKGKEYRFALKRNGKLLRRCRINPYLQKMFYFIAIYKTKIDPKLVKKRNDDLYIILIGYKMYF